MPVVRRRNAIRLVSLLAAELPQSLALAHINWPVFALFDIVKG